MTYSTLGNAESTRNYLDQPLFLGDTVGIARYDKVRYPQFNKLTERAHSYNWIPDEVDLTKDVKDFRKLMESEQEIVITNLRRQILSDTFAARGPSITLLPLVSQPELETWIQTWAFFETVHSRSYTHIIRTVFPTDPGRVLDGILDVPEIVSSVKDTSDVFDRLYKYGALYNLYREGVLVIERPGTPANAYRDSFRDELYISEKELKKLIYLAFVQMNILEGIRFYVSFACTWAFAEQRKMMEGNAKVLKLICRDENLHLAGTQHVIKVLSEDPDFEDIIKETEPEVRQMFRDAVKQEQDFAKFVLRKGSTLGLSVEILSSYVEHRAHKCMSLLGYESDYKHASQDNMPWTKKWISGGDVQVAPQETQITSYRIGVLDTAVNENAFEGYKL
jgi:ribonucleoside-diphosphate reductase beta chain